MKTSPYKVLLAAPTLRRLITTVLVPTAREEVTR